MSSNFYYYVPKYNKKCFFLNNIKTNTHYGNRKDIDNVAFDQKCKMKYMYASTFTQYSTFHVSVTIRFNIVAHP